MPLTVAQGGTAHLTVLYEDGNGALVDPSTPLLEIINPSSVSVASGLVPSRASLGNYYYDWAVAANAALGDWTARFTGVISGSTVTGDDTFTVVLPGSVSPFGTVPLISLPEFKAALGITTTNDDPRWTFAINAATVAIRNYTDRDFGLPTVTEQRTFEYDGSGYLDIDDAAEITAVTMSASGLDTLVPADEWRAHPYQTPVFTWIYIPTQYGLGSPEMGFTRNIDVYAREGRRNWLPNLVKVDGTWGWPLVPDDVKQAAIWTAYGMKDQPGAYVSESIEGYSRTLNQRTPAEALPSRVQDLLMPYVRLKV